MNNAMPCHIHLGSETLANSKNAHVFREKIVDLPTQSMAIFHNYVNVYQNVIWANFGIIHQPE